MRDVLEMMRKWATEHRSFAVARVLQTWGSSPRPVGSAMIVSASGEMAGSVSGGCVEGSIVKEANNIIGTGKWRVLDYGVTDEEAWTVGLSCGGKIKVLLQDCTQSVVAMVADVTTRIADGKECAFITALHAPDEISIIADTATPGLLPPSLKQKAFDLLNNRTSELIQYEGHQYFVQVFPGKSTLLIIGAAHITVDLVNLASKYDFETVVIDPRGAFASKTQFETLPDRIIEDYPSQVLPEYALDHNTFAVILSHDPKIDDNALHVLLRSKVAYIGALGSRKTHEKRRLRLEEAGFSQPEIDRIESPIGTDINALGAKEIALSIMGSLIRSRNAHY
jgi:xanthine dehydrogenase accessory factor